MAKKKEILTFEAIKNKYIDDEDGEAMVILRVNMKEKISAFAIPAKKRLQITVEILK